VSSRFTFTKSSSRFSSESSASSTDGDGLREAEDTIDGDGLYEDVEDTVDGSGDWAARGS